MPLGSGTHGALIATRSRSSATTRVRPQPTARSTRRTSRDSPDAASRPSEEARIVPGRIRSLMHDDRPGAPERRPDHGGPREGVEPIILNDAQTRSQAIRPHALIMRRTYRAARRAPARARDASDE